MKLEVDITHEFFVDAGVEVTHDGQDVSASFDGETFSPVRAKVLRAVGPGGGNPCIELEFIDEDHAWEWFSNWYMPDDADAASEFEACIIFGA